MNSGSVAFDQVNWQDTFLGTLDQQTKPGDEFRADQVHANRLLDFSIWSSDCFDVSLFQRSLSTYHTQKVITVARQLFEETLPELKEAKDLFIGFTGSDGRDEKLSPISSPVEIVVGFQAKHTIPPEVMEKIRLLMVKHPQLFFSAIEVKCLETDSLMTYKGLKDERPFPTRALDTQFLCGDRKFFTVYREAFFKELQDPKNNKLLTQFKKSAVKPACKVLKDVKSGVDKTQIDLSTGKVFHDGKRIKAVKYPYLRPIQYKLAMHIFSLIQSQRLSMVDFMQMPWTTVDRLQWLADRRFINAAAEEIKTFQKAYVASLVWFALSQKKFEVSAIAETSFPSRDLKEVAHEILKFCDALSIGENG